MEELRATTPYISTNITNTRIENAWVDLIKRGGVIDIKVILSFLKLTEILHFVPPPFKKFLYKFQ
jgi:hypothetical protein